MFSFPALCNSALVAIVALYLFFLNLRSGVSVLCSSNEDGQFIVSRTISDMDATCICNQTNFLTNDDKSAREKKDGIKRFFEKNKKRKDMNADSTVSNIESVHYEIPYGTETENLFCYGAIYTLVKARSLLPFVPPVPIASQNQCPGKPKYSSQLEYQQDSAAFKSKRFIRKKLKGIGHFLQKNLGKKKSNIQTNKDDISIALTKQAPDWLKVSYHNPNAPLSTGIKQKQLIEDLDRRLKQRFEKEGESDSKVQTFEKRMEGVHWGGYGPKFWPKHSRHSKNDSKIDGTHLIAAYLKIMEWPKDLRTKFPFKLCHAGCDADFAIAHTIEWREKYKPWLITPSALIENEKGWIYYRGYSKNPYVSDNRKGGYSMIWYRPGLKKNEDSEAYIRALINTFELAIADAFIRTNDKIGKVNVVLDCTGFKFSYVPTISQVGKVLKMLQDHFPDKLGMLIIANLQGAGGLVLKMIMPLLPAPVKEKITVLPNDPEKSLNLLRSMVDEEYLPDWLGGSDSFRFNKESYYNKDGLSRLYCSEEEGRRYLVTMPYHA